MTEVQLMNRWREQPLQKSIGERLAMFREAVQIKEGMSCEDFCRILDIHVDMLKSYECGWMPLDYVLLFNIHELLGLNIDWLVTGAGEMVLLPEEE
jgi:transcriptional regulator with XRE-family HTH domain